MATMPTVGPLPAPLAMSPEAMAGGAGGPSPRQAHLTDLNHSNLYVKNLPPEFDQTAVECMFREFGIIQGCKFFRNATPPYAFIKLNTAMEAQNAVAGLNGTSLMGRQLLVKIADTDAQYENPNENLYVRNCPLSWNEETIRTYFGQWGSVTSVKLLPVNGAATGQACMVRLGHVAEAQVAKDATNAVRPPGEALALNVKFADTPEEKLRKLQTKATKGVPGNRFAPYPLAAGGGMMPPPMDMFPPDHMMVAMGMPPPGMPPVPPPANMWGPPQAQGPFGQGPPDMLPHHHQPPPPVQYQQHQPQQQPPPPVQPSPQQQYMQQQQQYQQQQQQYQQQQQQYQQQQQPPAQAGYPQTAYHYPGHDGQAAAAAAAPPASANGYPSTYTDPATGYQYPAHPQQQQQQQPQQPAAAQSYQPPAAAAPAASSYYQQAPGQQPYGAQPAAAQYPGAQQQHAAAAAAQQPAAASAYGQQAQQQHAQSAYASYHTDPHYAAANGTAASAASTAYGTSAAQAQQHHAAAAADGGATKVSVSNLPTTVDKLALYETFAPFGGTLSVILAGGRAVIQYADAASASKAAATMNNAQVQGAKLQVAVTPS